MKKLSATVVIIACIGVLGTLKAQQDPQFTQFMFNKLAYNPGYAGTTGAYCGVMQYRKQWVSFAGAPTSMAFTGDARLPELPIGVGLTIINDGIGPMNTFFLRAAAAFNLKIGDGMLGLGMDIGIQQRQINSAWIVPEPLKNDPHIPGSYDNPLGTTISNPNFSKLGYDLGVGAFYQIPKKFYVGLSSTHLTNQTLKSGDLAFKVAMHYYLTAGGTIPITPWVSACPNILYKGDLSIATIDANLNLLWFDMVWAGMSYRVSDAACLLFGYQGKAMNANALGYKIGFAYDFPTSDIKGYTTGSLEFILGACYTPKVKKTTTYANDRFLD